MAVCMVAIRLVVGSAVGGFGLLAVDVGCMNS